MEGVTRTLQLQQAVEEGAHQPQEGQEEGGLLPTRRVVPGEVQLPLQLCIFW